MRTKCVLAAFLAAPLFAQASDDARQLLDRVAEAARNRHGWRAEGVEIVEAPVPVGRPKRQRRSRPVTRQPTSRTRVSRPIRRASARPSRCYTKSPLAIASPQCAPLFSRWDRITEGLTAASLAGRGDGCEIVRVTYGSVLHRPRDQRGAHGRVEYAGGSQTIE